MPSTAQLRPELTKFLRQLAKNNNREWFQKNKERYEGEVRDPLLRFVEAFGPRLQKISPHFVADPKKMGGSLFRIYRDTRFSRDKSPYKTFCGVQFRHERAKDVHAPGFYLHIQPDEVFVGVGLWHPEGDTLRLIRDAIVIESSTLGTALAASTKRSISVQPSSSRSRSVTVNVCVSGIPVRSLRNPARAISPSLAGRTLLIA